MRRGQASIFIILGLLILGAIALSFMVQQGKLQLQQGAIERIGTTVPQKAVPIKTFIESCLAKTGDPAVRLLALQGGRINFSDEAYAHTSYVNISYALTDGKSTLVSQADMEQELAGDVQLRMRGCIGDLGELRKQWQQVSAETLTINASIMDDQVLFRMRYPLTLIDQEGVTTISDFQTLIPLRLGRVHGIVANITKVFARNPDWIDTTYLANIPEYAIGIIPEQQDTYVLSITDNQNIGKPLVFLAAVHTVKNAVPRIAIGSNYTTAIGQPFTLKVNATDDGPVQFSDDTTLFNIDPSGLIQFTPHVSGTQTVQITATDEHGKFDTATVNFTGVR